MQPMNDFPILRKSLTGRFSSSARARTLNTLFNVNLINRLYRRDHLPTDRLTQIIKQLPS